MKTNNKILILGGTSGVGFQTAKRLSKDNQVIVVGRNENKGSLAAVIGNIEFIKCDISVKPERDNLIKNLKKENIIKVVHCAGIFSKDKNPKYEKEYEEVKMGGVEIIKELSKNNILSHALAVGSLYTFLPEHESYNLERRIHKSLEEKILEINKEGLIVNCIAPGLVDTELSRKGFGEDFDKVLEMSPGSRALMPEEVVEVICWLINQNVIKNHIIPIDGGYLRNFVK
jgi:NAD(P)-dependent dehydrogenase (short-subunit alcohol dehydrogenase family)